MSSFFKVLCDDVKSVEKDVQIVRRNPSLLSIPKREMLKEEAVKNLASEYSSEMGFNDFLDWLGVIGREARKTTSNLTEKRLNSKKSEVSCISFNIQTSDNLLLPSSNNEIQIEDNEQDSTSSMRISSVGSRETEMSFEFLCSA